MWHRKICHSEKTDLFSERPVVCYDPCLSYLHQYMRFYLRLISCSYLMPKL